jgi:hypothetical protein
MRIPEAARPAEVIEGPRYDPQNLHIAPHESESSAERTVHQVFQKLAPGTAASNVARGPQLCDADPLSRLSNRSWRDQSHDAERWVSSRTRPWLRTYVTQFHHQLGACPVLIVALQLQPTSSGFAPTKLIQTSADVANGIWDVPFDFSSHQPARRKVGQADEVIGVPAQIADCRLSSGCAQADGF